MDYKCHALTGYYGTIHSINMCFICKGLICSCFEKLTKCTLCDAQFCLECCNNKSSLTLSKHCKCRFCNDCRYSFDTTTEHGLNCKNYRNNIKFLLHMSDKFIVDIIDYMSDILWNQKFDES